MSMSKEQKQFIRKKRNQKILVVFIQLFLVIFFLGMWEYSANKKIINPFIFSSPSRILECIVTTYQSGDLILHIFTTFYETILAFVIGISLGFIIAIILYEFPLIAKIVEPFLTMLNSLPKVALGPMIIIWTGANTKSIIVMALLINLIVSILNIYNGFLGTDANRLKLMKTFQTSKSQTLFYLVIPSSKNTIVSSLKLNISMTLIGVIMGEFLVSKKGIGYLIIYGTQVFNLNIVMSGILILVVMSFLLYECVSLFEKKVNHHKK
ncbi:MAG: ABC transporter permease [Bacilli bacterium]|nr:ABC transporter permease [Bacilli bacterium]